MTAAYSEGVRACALQRLYADNPYGRKSRAFYEWCAGWNDEDIRISHMRYFVNDTNRMVRTDDTGQYTPKGDWREVTLVEWDDFRNETKTLKRKRTK